MNTRPKAPEPVGIWYTDETMHTDPDNVTAPECQLLAVVPQTIANKYASNRYDEATTEVDCWQSVQVFARPVSDKWNPAEHYGDQPDTEPMATALVEYLSARFGGYWEISPTGGGCDAITCEGFTHDHKPATLMMTSDATAPVVGMDRFAGITISAAGGYWSEESESFDVEANLDRLTADEIAHGVGLAIAHTRFTPSERTYTVTVTFTADRPLTDDEIADLTNTVAVQVEEPMMMNEDGDWSEATYSTTIKECGIANVPS